MDEDIRSIAGANQGKVKNYNKPVGRRAPA